MFAISLVVFVIGGILIFVPPVIDLDGVKFMKDGEEIQKPTNFRAEIRAGGIAAIVLGLLSCLFHVLFAFIATWCRRARKEEVEEPLHTPPKADA